MSSFTVFVYHGHYTIAFENEDIFYPELSSMEVTTIKEGIKDYLSKSELKTILVEHDVSSWETAEKIDLELIDIYLEKSPSTIHLGDYFQMNLTLRTRTQDISADLINSILRAIRNRFGSDSSQEYGGILFGRGDTIAQLV